MTTYPPNWSQRKQEKKAREAEKWLLPGETVLYQFAALSRHMSSEAVVTDARVFGYSVNRVGEAVRNSDITGVKVKGSNIIVETTDGGMKFSAVDRRAIEGAVAAIEQATQTAPPDEAAAELDRREELDDAASELWDAAVVLGTVRGKARRSIIRLSQPGEAPWLVLAPGVAQGVLAAFEDRLVIVKTGAMTNLMAGSLGGERATTFYFTDITAIEYNSGFLSGVLEVLTPSYQGTANKDFWRGSNNANRNLNNDNPYTLSNTLPLSKPEYISYTPHIQKLREKVAAAKRPQAPTVVVQAPAAPASSSLVAELKELAALRDAGVLTEEEFRAAKAQLIGR